MGSTATTPAGGGMFTMMTVIPQPVAPVTFTSMTMTDMI